MAEPRSRREPPLFRRVQVRARTARSSRLTCVTLGGTELEGFDPGLPAASIRLLLPAPLTDEPEPIEWNGNEFLRADGTRPPIRTLTPLRFDPEALELDVEVVLHEHGLLSDWAADAAIGSAAAVSGTGRGYDIDPQVDSHLLAGDESAIPAIGTLLAAIPHNATVQVLIESPTPDEQVELPFHPGVHQRWSAASGDEVPGTALLAALRVSDIGERTHVWAAGEAAAVQRIRTHLFDERGVPRTRAHVRGYWKLGRDGAGTS